MGFTTLSNMGLKVPTRSTVNWDTTVLQTFTDIDAHDHTSGKGVQIPTAGIADDAVTAAKILLTNNNGLKQKDSGGTGRVLINLNASDTLELLDSGGNEILTGAATASAVNYLDITNAATGNGPTLAAAGDDANIDLTLSGKGTGNSVFGGTVLVPDEIQHVGDTNNKIGFTTDTQTFTTGGSTRLDITDSGVQLGAANARVTTILDEDTMSSDSPTALATQQSVKAYVDSSAFDTSELTLKDNWTSNLGLSYSGGTLYLQSATGNNLSSSNPAYITLPAKGANTYAPILYTITTGQNFIDASGSSEITGNLFGTTTGIAWGEDCPFYLYAVANDNEDTIAFMISRVPHRTTAPAVGEIGAPDDAVADNQYSFFSFDNIDETLYDGNPCRCIGSFRMRKDASDDWTVQTITCCDGIGLFNEDNIFTYPKNQNAAASGTHFLDNGGTAPQGSTEDYEYKIDKTGMISLNCRYVVNNSPAGAVQLKLAIPLTTISTPTTVGVCRFFNGTNSVSAICETIDDDLILFDGTGSAVVNSDVASSDQLNYTIRYPIKAS